MADITNELIYEILKKMQDRLGSIDGNVREVKQELISIRGHMLSMQNDIHNIYAKLDRYEERLERIERRLELRELAEPPHPFEPRP